ncbi:MAG TPA: hypothetical protein VK886_16995 [Vicinamibacterales bacterium]|nr:hypothetical protein [Vicinamibacterales bacterium]
MSVPARARAPRAGAFPRWSVHAGEATLVRRQAVTLLALLLALDVLLIAADVFRHRGVLDDVRFAITRERGFGELLQYAKFAGLIFLLLTAASRPRVAPLWALVFAVLLLDDSNALHERLGLALASRLALPAIGPLRPVDFGELIVFAGATVAILVPLGLVLWRGDPASCALTLALAPPLALLGVFAAGADFVHSLSRAHSFRYLTGLVDDGGEMVATSLLVAVGYFQTRRGPSA